MSGIKITWGMVGTVPADQVPGDVYIDGNLKNPYAKLKSLPKKWAYQYCLTVNIRPQSDKPRRAITLQVFDNSEAGKYVYIGRIGLVSGRDDTHSFSITSPRINLERRATQYTDTHTRLVQVKDIARAVSIIKSCFYPETIEERIEKEKESVKKLMDGVTHTIRRSLGDVYISFTGHTGPVYAVSINHMAMLKSKMLYALFDENATLDTLRNMYEPALDQLQVIADLQKREADLMRMLDKVHRVSYDGDTWSLRTMQGSVMGAPIMSKNFDDLPENVRNAVVALRMMGEGVHEGLGVNLTSSDNDGVEVFWINDKE